MTLNLFPKVACLKTILFSLLFLSASFIASAQAPFITVWQTDSIGTSEDNQITIPGTGTNYTIAWEEVGNEANNNGNETGTDEHTITFPSVGTYRVKISGDFTRIKFENQGDKEKLIDIAQWGDIGWSDFSQAFQGCSNLNMTATDSPDLSNISDMSRMFFNAASFNGAINNWEVSSVTDMSFIFYGASSFNQDIGSWDVTSVTNMSGMFCYAISFNQEISKWDVSNITNMSDMFRSASSFNQDLASWDVSSVTNMSGLFGYAISFNQEITQWDVSNVTNMSDMFSNASSFNQDVSQWDVSSVTNMRYMFYEATSFNSDISSWNVFNVSNMYYMLFRAAAFNQNLGRWDISNVSSMDLMLSSTNLNTNNYDSTLIGWANQEALLYDVNLGNVRAEYCAAIDARAKLVNTYNWSIADNYCLNSFFVTRWKTDNNGESNNNQLTIPGTGIDYLIEWEQIGNLSNNGQELGNNHHTLTFPNPGEYRVKISGDFNNIRFANTGDKNKLLSVDSWGQFSWKSMESAFYGCENLEIKAAKPPSNYRLTDMSYAFKGTPIIGRMLTRWDTDEVVDMTGTFANCPNFKANLDNWNVSNVASFKDMFNGARTFSQSLHSWEITSASNMEGMLDSTALSIDNYDKTLIGWSEQANGPNGITLGVKGLAYCLEDGRTLLLNNKKWNFVGDFNDCSNQFITVWKTDNPGRSNDNQIYIPGRGEYRIDWEEVGNSSNRGFENVSNSYMLTFPTAGVYRVKISGGLTSITLKYGQNGSKIVELEQWGNILWNTMASAFYDCDSLIISASDVPNLSDVQDMSEMFWKAKSFNGDLSSWNVSSVTNMSGMFRGATAFNGDISTWDVSSVTNMSSMFEYATAFNGDISTWNVSSVTNMSSMFRYATAFNGDINNWEVSSVTDMSFIFHSASSFNQDIGSWDVSSVKDMNGMFYDAYTFNKDISSWNVSSVRDMSIMFRSANAFNGEISSWNISNVTDMKYMFSSADLFNQDLSKWDVSSVTNMNGIFDYATSFNQNLGDWDISNVTTLKQAFTNSGLDTYNYDQTLIGWSQLDSLKDDIELGVHGLRYCISEEARRFLMEEKGWTINDYGRNCRSTFISIWDSRKEGESEIDQITIPASGGDYYVLWEALGNTEMSGIELASGYHTINFPAAGNYRIKIAGDINRISFSDLGDKYKITEIENWGDIRWASMNAAFAGAENLIVTADDAPDLSQVTDLSRMFYKAKSLNQDINHWDVSNVLDMSDLFHGASTFNQDLSSWDVSNVTKMSRMFASATAFNQNLTAWDISNVTDMDFMFWDADFFNSDISSWDVTNVSNMWGMFYSADSMNTDLSNWDVSRVTNMTEMFREAGVFNQEINDWNVSNVTNISGMFYDATSFDQNLGSWNLSKVNSLFEFLTNSGLSVSSYDLSLEGWATNGNLPSNIALSVEGLNYCASEAYRQQLINEFGWNVIGDDNCSLVFIESIPAAEATSVAKNTEIYLIFDQEIKELDFSGVLIRDFNGNVLSLQKVEIDSSRLNIFVDGLNNSTYEVVVPEGSFVSITGKENEAISWTFTTQNVLSNQQELLGNDHSNYPNPFTDFTYIQFNLKDVAPVVLRVYDVKGNLLRIEQHAHLSAGEQRLKFERKDLPAGLYHYQLQTSAGSVAGKMLIK